MGMTDDDNDIGDTYRALRKESQDRRARNRNDALASLRYYADKTERPNKVSLEVKNEGAHVIVKKGPTVIDYWPGTGLWIERGKQGRKRGVVQLMTYLKIL